MATNPSSRSRGIQQQNPSSTGSNVRRNLFSSTLSRRPNGNPSASTSTSTVHSSNTEDQTTAADIVVRDEHGNYKLDLPQGTPIPRDEAREERGQFGVLSEVTTTTNLTFWSEVENRLIETYMKHQQHIEPNGKQRDEVKCYTTTLTTGQAQELKATLQASLQAKVASLDDDNWMFEKDDGAPQ